MYVATSREAAELAREWLADGSRHNLNAPQGVLWVPPALRQQWGVSAKQLAQDDIFLMESAAQEPLEEARQWLAAYAEHARHHAGVPAG